MRVGAKFCDECGSAVGQTAAVAEYKQVTVLFADVVHSMDIAAAVGPERLREIMSEVFDRCCDVVRRYGGTVDKFTGDGVMAVFGAPIALEDHAIRACMAALEIQHRVRELELQLRVGLNSGEVIVGEVGSRAASYTAIGDQVGLAQRMESVAPPGRVMLSESTARLVAGESRVGERQLVSIKGAAEPVAAYVLLSVTGRSSDAARTTSFVGREWELAALTAMLDRSIAGRGCVVGLAGQPGIGKSRLAAELATLAESLGVQVYSTYCESHTSDVAFQAVRRLLRSALGVQGMEPEDARTRIRSLIVDVGPEDIVLVYDELGIRGADDPLPEIAPDARRRRLTSLVNTFVLARREPALYIIEDAHWIDPTSESLLADFFSVVPQTSSMVVVTFRPEYQGALSRSLRAQTVALTPLEDSQIDDMVTELLGSHPSVSELANRIVLRAAGNPFFAEEIVRDLADRGVLRGDQGAFTCSGDAADVDVPATVQAALSARIDRLPSDAKLALSAAAVIGLRFAEDLLAELSDPAAVEALLKAELIDQVSFAPRSEYAFRHPLVRSVAYRSQLMTARADLHRRLATVLEAPGPEAADNNAALIAEHLEAAGDLAAAFNWHMRAASGLVFRDIGAARSSWQRARDVADRLPMGEPARDAMRIAPRTMLCGSTFRAALPVNESEYFELRELAAAIDDKVSLAIATGGQVGGLSFAARYREAAALATELANGAEAIDDPAVKVMLLPQACMAKLLNGEVAEGLRLAERVIELCQGDRFLGKSIVESPLTIALMLRAAARMALGAEGWKRDMERAVEESREYTPIGEAILDTWRYGIGIAAGALRADDAAVRATAEIVSRAERSADEMNVVTAHVMHGLVLAEHGGPARAAGLPILADARRAVMENRTLTGFLTICEVELARELVRTGEVDTGIEALVSVFDREMTSEGTVLMHARIGELVVEALVHRATSSDIAEAQAVIDRIAALPVEEGFVLYELPLLRARALLARAHGDDEDYRRYREEYRMRAHELDFEGHIDTAAIMP